MRRVGPSLPKTAVGLIHTVLHDVHKIEGPERGQRSAGFGIDFLATLSPGPTKRHHFLIEGHLAFPSVVPLKFRAGSEALIREPVCESRLGEEKRDFGVTTLGYRILTYPSYGDFLLSAGSPSKARTALQKSRTSVEVKTPASPRRSSSGGTASRYMAR